LPPVSNVPLTGFSHGAAGIALALLRLSAATQDHRFRTAALAAIAYERSVFSPRAQNWPDLRTASRHTGRDDIGATFATLWCHGAAGIGLARLACREFLDDPFVDAEIDIAVQTTCRDGFGGGHSLCHGALGNLELLLAAGQRPDSSALKARTEEVASTVLDEADHGGWRCGNRAAAETPGLMTGLAGIGYQLLRLAEPARVPSVLAFDPPIAVSQLARRGR
jgi:lantibiotic modifying enzyme